MARWVPDYLRDGAGVTAGGADPATVAAGERDQGRQALDAGRAEQDQKATTFWEDLSTALGGIGTAAESGAKAYKDVTEAQMARQGGMAWGSGQYAGAVDRGYRRQFPWGTILLLGVVGGGVYWLATRK